MRIVVTFAFIFAFQCGLITAGRAQIMAVTTDGKKVILNSDGTWKYIFENDGRKVILNPDGTWKYDTAKTASVPFVKHLIHDSLAAAPVDTAKLVPVKPVIIKAPLNLDCSYLVAVERNFEGDKFAAESRKIMVTDNPKAAFSVVFKKTKNTPLQWIVTLSGTGQCIEEDSKINIVFKDGTRLQIPNDGKANCTGTFALYFGGIYGKESTLESLQNKEVTGVRIWTAKSFVDGNFTEDNTTLFKATVNCIANTK